MDNIAFGKAFYSFRKPAWHRFGFVSDVPMGAQEAHARTVPYALSLEPLFAEVEGRRFATSQRGIFRHPVPDDDEFKLLGVVGDEYRLIDPATLCQIYDDNVKSPIETMAALGNGETFFFSTKLPTFDVGGDEVENYMLTISPYTGGEALSIRITQVRAVCENTLMTAKRQSSETYRIRHDDSAAENLGAWMTELMGRVEKKTEDIRDIFVRMTQTQIAEGAVESIAAKIYADPNLPGNHPNIETMTRRMQDYEWYLAQAKLRRQQLTAVYEGAGVGQDTPAAKGTAWGLFNAACELEQYRSSSPAAGFDMIVGERAKIAEKAFTAMVDYMNDPSQFVVPSFVSTPKRPSKSKKAK